MSICGRVTMINLVRDQSGARKGFGFVSFFDAESAKKAVFELNNCPVGDGKQLIV